MNLYAENLSLASLVACWLLMLLTLSLAGVYASKYGDWARLASCSLTHVWHATIALVVATWSLKATLDDGTDAVDVARRYRSSRRARSEAQP